MSHKTFDFKKVKNYADAIIIHVSVDFKDQFVSNSGLLPFEYFFGVTQLLQFMRYSTWESNKLDYYLLHSLDINFSKQDVCTLHLLISVSATTSCRICPKYHTTWVLHIFHMLCPFLYPGKN